MRIGSMFSGLLGGLMSRLLLASFTGLPDRFCAYRRKRPVTFAAGCGLIRAGGVLGLRPSRLALPSLLLPSPTPSPRPPSSPPPRSPFPLLSMRLSG